MKIHRNNYVNIFFELIFFLNVRLKDQAVNKIKKNKYAGLRVFYKIRDKKLRAFFKKKKINKGQVALEKYTKIDKIHSTKSGLK